MVATSVIPAFGLGDTFCNAYNRRTDLASLGHEDELSLKRVRIAALYETHFERVALYIAARIGNRSEAEDLASEVFLRAIRSAETYRETGAPLEAWVFRIAHNMVVDHLRQRSRRPASEPLEQALLKEGEEDPIESVESQEEVQQLREVMGKLSPAQRQVLALRFGSELTSEQVAQVMGKNPGAVREMQSAAIKKLRRLLQSRLQEKQS